MNKINVHENGTRYADLYTDAQEILGIGTSGGVQIHVLLPPRRGDHRGCLSPFISPPWATTALNSTTNSTTNTLTASPSEAVSVVYLLAKFNGASIGSNTITRYITIIPWNLAAKKYALLSRSFRNALSEHMLDGIDSTADVTDEYSLSFLWWYIADKA
jgi:hypothetical protein